jgi:S1-C subfamily serine protease
MYGRIGTLRPLVAVLVVVLLAVGAGTEAPAGAGTGTALGAVVGVRARQAGLVVRVVGLGCGGIALGSGVVVPGGRVLTNRHVVAGADYVEVRRSDGVRIGARVESVGRDVDLAVLWAGAAVGPGVAPAGHLGRGQPVTVLGHPGGGPAERADGRVTARARFDEAGMRVDAAWVDAPVAPGSSGGPAFAGTGVVGVVFAREDHTGLAGVIDGDTAAAFLAGALPAEGTTSCAPD